MLVVVAVGEQAVTQRTEWIAVLVIAAFETGQGVIIAFGMQQTDGAQRLQVVVDVAQDRFVAFTGIAQEFPDLEIGETGPQGLEARDGEQMVCEQRSPDISRGAGPGQRPELEKTIIDNTKGLGFVAKVMFTAWFGRLLGLRSAFPGRMRVGAGLVGA